MAFKTFNCNSYDTAELLPSPLLRVDHFPGPLSIGWLVHSQLALPPESCTYLPLFGSNSVNWPRSELQFCENPVRWLHELCSFTSGSPVSDCVFSVSLFSVWIPADVCSLSWVPCQWTTPFAIMCVPVQPNCGTAVRTGNWVLCCGSPVSRCSISAPVVTVKVSVCCKCSTVCMSLL